MTAGSIFRCSLIVVDESHSVGRLEVDRVWCITSRWPMSLEANSEVPPRSLAEQRRISVLPQFSTMVSAADLP
jgi:hypothetical protein